MNYILQPSLFPALKEDFHAEAFTKTVCSESFINHIKNGILKGFEIAQDKAPLDEYSLRIQSSILHESVFNSIKKEFEIDRQFIDVSFCHNIYGSERLHFCYSGYIFIIKLDGSSQNETKQSESIINQELDRHIITISYSISQMRDCIQSISLLYKKGKYVDFLMNIGTSYIVDEMQPENEHIIEVKKPRLKIRPKETSEL